MKIEIKVMLILFLLIGAILIPIKNVNAHSVELDPTSLISLPMMIVNGKGNITIKNSETDYKLYYQAVEIQDKTYTQIEQTYSDGDKELDNIKKEIDTLDKECDNLKTTYDEAYKAYKNKLDSGEQDAELEELKTEYETAEKNYQNKAKEYNNKVKEYNNKYNEIDAKIRELTPTYVENNWTKTEDGSFKVDLSQFTGEKAFAIWAKLVSSDGTISYDELTYTLSGTKKENINVEGISLDKTTLTLTVGECYTLTATITPSDASDKLINWKSNDENIATVSNGKITAKSTGTTTITATTNDGSYTAICKVTVSEKLDTSKDDTFTNTEENNTQDTTIADGKLPQTGINMTILSIVFVVILIAVLFYKKYYSYRDIK